MEVSELTIWIARLSVLAVMYLFLLALVAALLLDARATARAAIRPAAPSAPAPAASSGLRLVVSAGMAPPVGRDIVLQAPVEIGRDAACGIVLANGFVSSRHARLYPAAGGWMVEDLGSTNGTVLNDAPVTAPRRLASGDHLLIGDTLFIIQ